MKTSWPDMPHRILAMAPFRRSPVLSKRSLDAWVMQHWIVNNRPGENRSHMGFLKGERKPMRTRYMQVALLGGVLLLVLAGCGRVNLEDLTPEAVKTQQAEAAITQTAAAEAAAEAGTEFDGNPARGDVLYGTWCINCHDGGRADPIRGNAYPFSEWEDFFRTGGDIDHPSYDPFVDLSDQNLIDILTYIVQS